MKIAKSGAGRSAAFDYEGRASDGGRDGSIPDSGGRPTDRPMAVAKHDSVRHVAEQCSTGHPRTPFDALATEIHACRRCPRLVEWREARAADPPRRYPGRGLLGATARRLRRPSGTAGDRRARSGGPRRQPDRPHVHRRPIGRLALRGPAPCGLRKPAHSRRIAATGCGCSDAYVTAVVRCAPPANRPTPEERDTCLPYLERELELLEHCQTIVALGGFAWDGSAAGAPRSSATRSHGQSHVSATAPRRSAGRWKLLGCYHPSQQNTFTGRLTEPMLDAVFSRARELQPARAPRLRSAPRGWEFRRQGSPIVAGMPSSPASASR